MSISQLNTKTNKIVMGKSGFAEVRKFGFSESKYQYNILVYIVNSYSEYFSVNSKF